MKRILSALFALVSVTSWAAPFQNGGFEIGALTADPCNTPLGFGSTAITGWTVMTFSAGGGPPFGDIDYLNSNCWTPSEGSRSLDLVGTGTIGGIQQTFDTVAGQAYEVLFDFAGNPGTAGVKKLNVSVGATSRDYTFDPTSYSAANMGWTTHSFQFVAGAGISSTLSFYSNMTGSAAFAGAALDNVRVLAIPAGAWTGSGGTVYSGTQTVFPPASPMICSGTGTNWSQSGGGPFSYPTYFTSFGVQGPVIASYAVPQGNTTQGICGAWGATTTATSAGLYTVQYDYSGNHNSFQVTVGLQAFVIGAASPDQSVELVNYFGPPGVPFAYTGQYTFNVQAGDIYGFKMTGSNSDSTDAMRGTLYLTGNGASSMSLVSFQNPAPVLTQVSLSTVVTGVNNPTGTVSFSDGGIPIAGCTNITIFANPDPAFPTASCSLSSLTAGVHNIGVTYSGDMFNKRASNNTLVQTITAVGPTLATPVLIRSLPTGSAIVPLLIGRVDGAPNTPVTVRLYSGTTCTNGVLGGTVAQIGSDASPLALPVLGSTDPNGYFGTAQSGAQGQFVAIGIVNPQITALSNCVVSAADNDTWPKALRLLGDSVTVPDWIDAAGKARWYRFSVLPGQSIQVTMSGLPADYDLAVFKDIAVEFANELVPANTAELTRLSAQFAPSAFSPSAFSPSAFSPSAFSPSAFSPSAFSPSAFSPSAFSPSAFSPSAFSPSAFSPSAFSPSAFSPSAFSPSAFSPSAFSPSAFSPSAFSPTELQQAFSSAQTRSIIATSMTPGTGNESVLVNTWNNTGDFYVRVTGRTGAFSSSPYNLAVTKSGTSCAAVTDTVISTRSLIPNAYNTIVLVDSSKTSLSNMLPPNGVRLGDKLTEFVRRTDVNGMFVDVSTDSRVSALKTQATSNAGCPFAKNLVALEIKSIIDAYQTPNLRYVVIVGNDDAIPFFRYPDQTLLGQESGYVPPVSSSSASEASLRGNFILSQDFYGAINSISLRASEFPIPGLAVGRLIETPAEIVGMIDAYTATNGSVSPNSSLVTGYDFLQDAADAVRTELAAGTGNASDALITPNTVSPADTRSYINGGPWTATDLRNKLVNSHHDVMFLAGHFSANSALAADFTTSVITTDLATASLTNTLVFSAGCHSGYNLVDTDGINGVTFPLDWAQAFAQKGATLVAGTGYQYGDTEFIEYSERLYLNFAKELRAGTRGTNVAIGEALVKAKRAYLAATSDVRGLHEKAVLEATLFGLPMLGVNMPGARTGVATNSGVIDAVDPLVPSPATAALGLKIFDLPAFSPTLTSHTLSLKNYDTLVPTTTIATWLSGPDGVVTNPVEPALPLQVVNVTPRNPNHVLRGVGFRGASYSDSLPLFPLTGAPTTELRGVHTPFSSPVFFPMRLWTSNYFSALAGGSGTNLLVTPAQHRALDATYSTLRQYSGLTLRLFYSDFSVVANANKAAFLSDAPNIVRVDTARAGSTTTFSAQVVGDPAAAIHQVWVTYTNGVGGNSTWTSLNLMQCVTPLPAVCGTTADSQLWKGEIATSALPADTRYIVQAASGTGLVSLDDNLGRYYSIGGAALVATSISVGAPSPSTVNFGSSVTATAVLSAGTSPLNGKVVTIAAGGSARTGTTDVNGSVTVLLPMLSAPGTYSLSASFGGDSALLPSSASAPTMITVNKAPTTLMPALSGAGVVLTAGTQPLIQESIQFQITGPLGAQTVFAITDYAGRATIPSPGLPSGTYCINQAYFAGNATYTAATLNATRACYLFTGFFRPVDNLPTLNSVKAGSSVPVKFSLGGNFGLTIFNAGSPKSQPIVCDSAAAVDVITTTVIAGSSSLSYDTVTGIYTYVWKTDGAWTGCRQLILFFNDGWVQRANFKFTK